jgi:neutral trehalase
METSEASRGSKCIPQSSLSGREWLGSAVAGSTMANITTIKTTEVVPVDLNCLLYQLEVTLARAFRVK